MKTACFINGITQVSNLVFQECGISAQVPGYIIISYYSGIQCYFQAGVIYFAIEIFPVPGTLRTRLRNGDKEKGIRSYFLEILNRSCQTIIPNCEIKTNIRSGYFFPLQVGVSIVVELGGTRTRDADRCKRCTTWEFLVSCNTPTYSQF